MISKNEFSKLKRGDVVLFNGKPRTVQQGPADKALTVYGERRGLAITFSIMRRSWTNRAYTVYHYNDVKDKISLPNKKVNFAKICSLEKETLKSIGFNWHNEMWREIKEEEDFYDRCNLPYPRSLKMARKFIERVDKK